MAMGKGGVFSGWRRYQEGIAPDVVRVLFGSSGGMFGCTQEKCEQSPNKVSNNTGTRPDRHRIPQGFEDHIEKLGDL
jgi:hypothetical protein